MQGRWHELRKLNPVASGAASSPTQSSLKRWSPLGQPRAALSGGMVTSRSLDSSYSSRQLGAPGWWRIVTFVTHTCKRTYNSTALHVNAPA